MSIRAIIAIVIYVALLNIIFAFGWNLTFAVVISVVYLIVTVPWIFNMVARKKLPPKNGGENNEFRQT